MSYFDCFSLTVSTIYCFSPTLRQFFFRTIKERLNCWNWRNLTVLGRIQIIKSFVIPVFMYRAGLVCSHKEIVKEVNKIIFNFIWKGKDKVKRSALISDVENGGLRAPHFESIIKAQRIMCCKKFANFQQSSWKIILSHHLRQVGGRLLLSCNFSVKKLRKSPYPNFV